jgi:Domain of unknown function (DUF5134)
MTAPAWLADGLAIAMLTVALYCASRLIVARLLHRRTHYSVDAVHTAMGVAMAGMLTARLVSTTLWAMVFVAAAGWFGLRAFGGLRTARAGSAAAGSHLRHLVTSAAMVYMLLAVPSAAAASTPNTPGTVATMQMGAGPGVRFPTLALFFGAFMIGYTIMVTDRLSRRAPNPDSEAILAPRTVGCCQIAMNITMGYMLVTML